MSVRQNVEVRESGISGAGRGLFALKDLAPGDLVLSLDRPMVAELETDRLLDTCAWCFQRSEKDPVGRAQAASMGLPIGFVEVKACTGCRRVVYCSKACQSKAWKKEHKYECKVLAPTSRPDLPHGVRAVIKLLGRLQSDPGGRDEELYDILKFRPASGPESIAAVRNHNEERFNDFQMLAHAAWKYAGEPKLGSANPEGVAKGFTFNIMNNLFALSSPLDDTPLGKGFDPLLCSANHSCNPNAVFAFNQPVTVLRAVKPIKKGEEVFMRYIEVTNPFSVRAAELKETYSFSCQCPKCKKGAVFKEDKFRKRPEELPAAYYEVADKLVSRHEGVLHKYFIPANDEKTQHRLAAMQAEAFSVAEDGQAGIDEIKGALKMCIGSDMWSWTRQPVPTLCRNLFGLYLASGDPYRAFRLGLKMYFEIMPALVPETFYPGRLIDLWAMSTVGNVLCGPRHQAIYNELGKSGIDLRNVYFGFFLDLHENVPRMHGLKSPFGQVVESTYQQIMANIGISEDELKQKAKDVWPALESLGRSVNVDTI